MTIRSSAKNASIGLKLAAVAGIAAHAMNDFSQASGNMADWNSVKVPIKKDKKTTARRKANKLARKQRKLRRR